MTASGVSWVPAWAQEPDVQHLLSQLVGRLDNAEQRGSAKAQSVALTDKLWPELFNAVYESDKEALWERARQLHTLGWIELTPQAAARSPSGYAQPVRVTVRNAQAIREATGRLTREKTSSERWRDAVQASLDAPNGVKKAVGGYLIDIPGRAVVDVVARLNQLRSLKGQPLLLREVSAKLFWGMSKVLDNRQGLVAALLETDECPFAESPVQMQVFLPPAEHSAVLFIENQMTFERAVRSRSRAFDRLALVFASGFKASAQRLRDNAGCSLYYSSLGAMDVATRARFEHWLFGDTPGAENVFFWGDLDDSGMQILTAMRSSFPMLNAWQPGYAPMLEQLLAGHGHAPEAADKQGQRPVRETGCPYADSQLLPALARMKTYLDQESLCFE